MSCKKTQTKSSITGTCVSKYSDNGVHLKNVKSILKEQVAFVKNLPKLLHDTIQWYTMAEAYVNFNKFIREGEKNYNPEFEYHAANLQYIFDNIPPIKKSINVFRSVKKKEQILYNHAYMSTAIVFEKTIFFRNKRCCVINITIPAGSKIIPVYVLSEMLESEILIDKNSSIFITGSYVKKGLKFYSATYVPKISVISEEKGVITIASIKEQSSSKTKYILPIVKGSPLIYNSYNPSLNEEELQDIYIKYIKKNKTSIPPKPKSTVRVLSYNIHNGFYDVYSDKNNYYKVLDFITELNPDIIGFQELMWTEQVESKNKLMNDMTDIGYPYSVICKSLGTEDYIGNGIFSKYPISSTKHINLDKDPVNKEGRIGCIAIVKISNTVAFTIVNTHLDVWDDSGKTRKKQLNKIINYLDKDDSIIIMGDFNTIRKEDYSKEYLNWLSANKSGRGNLYKAQQIDFDTLDILNNNGYKDITDSTNDMISITTWSGKRVDYMYTKNIDVKKSFVLPIDLSDHFPLIGDLEI